MHQEALELARDLSARSTIKIKVGAVIFDKNGILAWGWNNPGNGYGDHAEHMAIRRFVRGNHTCTAPIYIAVFASRKGRPITSRPCKNCEKLLRGYNVSGSIYYKKEELEGYFVAYIVNEEYV